MSNLAGLASITLPIFLVMALGYATTRWRFVTADFIQGLGFFVLNIALPALVLHALISQDLRSTFSGAYLLAYGGGSLVTFALVFIVFRFLMRRDVTQSAIACLGGASSNSGFVGFPLASLAIGPAALTALPLAMLIENFLIIPGALALAESGRHNGKPFFSTARETLLRLIKMPLVLAIILGAILSLAGLHPPQPVATAVQMVANASAACALFVVGGTLAGIEEFSASADVGLIVTAKLILHPLAVVAGFMLAGEVAPPLMAAGIILAASPMLTVYPILAARFGLGQLGAVALVAATALSFITLTAVIGLLPAIQ